MTTPQDTNNNMMCEETQELIPVYLDRELDVLRNIAVESHFRACEACYREHATQSDLRSSIRTGAHYFKAPNQLKTRIKKKISEV